MATYCFRCATVQPMRLTLRRVVVDAIAADADGFEVVDAVCTACGTVYERQPVVEERVLERLV